MRFVVASLAFVLAALITWLWLSMDVSSRHPSAATAQIDEQPFGVPFSLVDQDNQPITEAALRGKPTALFFGFTHCPEICPTTLYELDSWISELNIEEQVNAYFVTIDPERDTPEYLGEYVSSVTEHVRGITGEPDAVREMARGFAVYFARVELDDGDYTMDHTASVFLLDSKGRLRKTIAYGENPETAKQKLRDLADT